MGFGSFSGRLNHKNQRFPVQKPADFENSSIPCPDLLNALQPDSALVVPDVGDVLDVDLDAAPRLMKKRRSKRQQHEKDAAALSLATVSHVQRWSWGAPQ